MNAGSLQIDSLTLRNVKRFKSLTLQLKPGINLISGPNESGKSTIALALRCAFIERVKSMPVAAMLRPQNSVATDAQPSLIALRFHNAQQTYELEKQFAPKKSTKLICLAGASSKVYLDDAAEEILLNLWQARAPDRGQSVAKHQGLLSLLWVSQADLQPAPWIEEAHLALSAELAKQLPRPTFSRTLSSRIETAIAELVGVRGVPVKAHAKRLAELAVLETSLQRLDESASLLQADLAELAALKASGTLEAEPKLRAEIAALDLALAKSQNEYAELLPLVAQETLMQEQQQLAATTAREKEHSAQQHLQQLRRQIDRRDALNLARTALRTSQQEHASELTREQQAIDAMQRELGARVIAVKSTRSKIEEEQQQQKRRALSALLQRHRHLDELAQAQAPRLAKLRKEAPSRASLHAQMQKLKAHLAQRQAQATELCLLVPLDASTTLAPSWNGAPLPINSSVLISEVANIDLADGIRLQITPAAARSEQLNANREHILSSLHQAIEALASAASAVSAATAVPPAGTTAALEVEALSGVDGWGQLLALLIAARNSDDWLAWVRRCDATLDALDALAMQLAEAEAVRLATLAELQRQLEGYSEQEINAVHEAFDVAVEPMQSFEAAVAPIQQSLFDQQAPERFDLSALQAQFAKDEKTVLQLEQTLRHRQQSFERAQAEYALKARELATFEGQWREMSVSLEGGPNQSFDPREQLRDLSESVAKWAAQAEAAESALLSPMFAQRRTAMRTLAQQIKATEANKQALQQSLQKNQLQQQRLLGRISALCQQNLEVQRAAVASEYQQLKMAVLADHRRIAALQHLKMRLDGIRRKVELDLSAPLNAKLAPYLLKVFGESAQVRFDERFMPTHIQRSNAAQSNAAQSNATPVGGSAFGELAQQELFEVSALSTGTCEQLALLVRLAYADVLADAGAAVLLVFDDVLAYSDQTRRDAFAEALMLAAARHQIILLSCQPNDWRALQGVHHLQLASEPGVSDPGVSDPGASDLGASGRDDV